VLFGVGLLSLLTLALLVYCVLNVVTTPEDQVRNLPKPLWLTVVLFFPLVGGLAWLVVGRPLRPAAPLPSSPRRGVPPEYDRPGRAIGRSPEDDEVFLRRLRERAEQQRRAAEEQRRAAEEQRRAAEQQRRAAEQQRRADPEDDAPR
jgi:hypothetical protein